MWSSLVVVHDLDIPGSLLAPFEANAPLIIDANAMLPTPTAVQGLEPVARWNAQILKPFRCVKGEKLGSCSTQLNTVPAKGLAMLSLLIGGDPTASASARWS